MKHPLLLALAAATAIAGAAALPARAQQPPALLPPGAGRDIVAVSCSQCHTVAGFTALRQGARAWRHQVYDMIERGAQISPDEIDTVVAYLTANFGPGVPVPGPTPGRVTLTPGNGIELVAAKCSLCHGIDRVVSAGRSRAHWDAIVARMDFLGAGLTTGQSRAVVDYLSANYAPTQSGRNDK